MAAHGPSEVMTLAEVAAYLQLAERTVLRMAQRGEIPATKIASQWRFLQPIVREWLVGQMQAFSASDVGQAEPAVPELLPLREILREALMVLDVQAGPKESVLKQLTEPMARAGFAREPDRLLAGLLDRERLMTTAVGHGIAIPHPRRVIEGMFPEPAVALGVCRAGTDFRAIDDQLVHVFFLVCATRDEIHLQLMARLSWLTRQDGMVARLTEAASPGAVTELVAGLGG